LNFEKTHARAPIIRMTGNKKIMSCKNKNNKTIADNIIKMMRNNAFGPERVQILIL
jgi:hypothetical protein